MSELDPTKRVWEELAADDPMWAVLTDPSKTDRQWDTEAFFRTGAQEISVVFEHLDSLGRTLPVNGVALDFGCGVGRLTQAIAKHCAVVHGVDISERMVAEANRLNRFPDRCHFHINQRSDLSLFPSTMFDFIYSSIVLQHVPHDLIEGYIGEFLRVLKPTGLLVFQLPDHFREAPPGGIIARLRAKVRLRSRIRKLLRGDKAPDSEIRPVMHMNAIPEVSVRCIVEKGGGRIIDVRLTNSTDLAFNGDLRFLAHEPQTGWVSKQYCVTR